MRVFALRWILLDRMFHSELPNTARSLLGFTAIQHLKRVSGAAGLTSRTFFLHR
jgi:hypothetical protein